MMAIDGKRILDASDKLQRSFFHAVLLKDLHLDAFFIEPNLPHHEKVADAKNELVKNLFEAVTTFANISPLIEQVLPTIRIKSYSNPTQLLFYEKATSEFRDRDLIDFRNHGGDLDRLKQYQETIPVFVKMEWHSAHELILQSMMRTFIRLFRLIEFNRWSLVPNFSVDEETKFKEALQNEDISALYSPLLRLPDYKDASRFLRICAHESYVLADHFQVTVSGNEHVGYLFNDVDNPRLKSRTNRTPETPSHHTKGAVLKACEWFEKQSGSNTLYYKSFDRITSSMGGLKFKKEERIPYEVLIPIVRDIIVKKSERDGEAAAAESFLAKIKNESAKYT